VIVLSDQENLPQIPSSVDVCRDELRLVSIARAEAENPGILMRVVVASLERVTIGMSILLAI
jgi:hypothetical protein